MATVFSNLVFLLLYFLSLYAEVQAQQNMCSPAAEEGTNYTLYNTNWSSSVSGTVMWDFDFDGDSSADLYANGVVTYNDEFSVLDPVARGIIIFNTLRDFATTYICLVDGQQVFTCELQVYNKPETPTCTEVIVHNDNTFTTSCTTVKVFPEALCRLLIKSSWTDITTKQSFQYSGPAGDPVYYSTTCDIQYDMTDMEEGTHTVTVAMFPDATGLNETYGATEASLGLTLSLPTVTKISCLQDNNVREGYLLQGETTTCRCQLAHGGVPKGKVQWSSPRGGDFSIESETDNYTTIRINNAGTFTCEGTSTLKGPYHSLSISLQTAYGPRSTEISHNATVPLDLCPSTDVYVEVKCAVDKSDINPDPTFELSSPPPSAFTRVQDNLDSATSEKYTQIYIVQPLVGGSHTLTCVARNSKFGQVVSAPKSTTIEVKAPPSTAPNIDVKGSRPDSLLVEKDDVTVTCTVTGGSPPVESVTITCEGREPVTASGTSVTLTWSNISLSDNGVRCVCNAAHVTQCYDLKSTVILDVVGDSSSSSSSDFILGLGVALGIATIIIIILLVIVFVLIRRRGWTFKHFTLFGKKSSQQQDQLGLEETQGPQQQQQNQQEQQQQQQQQQQQPQMPSTNAYDEINIDDRNKNSYSRVDPQLSDPPHKYTECVVKTQDRNVLIASPYENMTEATSPTSTQDTSGEGTPSQDTGEQYDNLRQTPNPQFHLVHQQRHQDNTLEDCPYEIPDEPTQVKKRANYNNVPTTSLRTNYENIPVSSIQETNDHVPGTDSAGSY